jgi:hypothetical protein
MNSFNINGPSNFSGPKNALDIPMKFDRDARSIRPHAQRHHRPHLHHRPRISPGLMLPASNQPAAVTDEPGDIKSMASEPPRQSAYGRDNPPAAVF